MKRLSYLLFGALMGCLTNAVAVRLAAGSARWKTPLPGRGHSSPIVWGNRIFLTAELDGPVILGAKAPKHIMDGKAQPFRTSGGGAARRDQVSPGFLFEP
ncbi:MAG: PQQ-binding-like beta-propeller repeat protein [Acidobacteria bacterium]|nr:PQQ-binding-like beta-propeller repeat protein [Acidobacteriota bacterium]MCI0620967.1 PQQ-binding-like beta-propeller repeat protein [Acidobacteriota bacterium]MCI0717618.1 PQQ-binding-like beta-propeller repeat protein [Acidobacteriota bacterium]